MRPFFFLIAFGGALWSIGEGWAALQGLWAAPSREGAAAVLGYLAVFAASFLYLGFGVYAADRAAGKICRRVGLYERFLAGQPEGRVGARGTASDPGSGGGPATGEQ